MINLDFKCFLANGEPTVSLIPLKFLNAVVALDSKNADETISWVASGFFYGKFLEQLEEDKAN